MNFDQITFSFPNGYLVYDVRGTCNFAASNLNGTQSIVCKLSKHVDIPRKVQAIDVNGICFKCTDIRVVGDNVVGVIERITSHEYSDALKFTARSF